MALKFHKSPFHVTHDEETADKMVLKMGLSIAFGKVIKEKGWTQPQAADALGISQSRVSDLMNHKIEKFSIDVIVDLVQKLGFKTTLSTQKRAQGTPSSIQRK